MDAALIASYLNGTGQAGYVVRPLWEVDVRHFIQSHAGHLNILVGYAFAAHNGRLTTANRAGWLGVLPLAQRFPVDVDVRDGFGLDFGVHHEVISRAFSVLRLPPAEEAFIDLLEASPRVWNAMAKRAIEAVEPTFHPTAGNSFARFDGRRWRIGDLDRLRVHGTV
jgi:hypothetical protein